MSLFVRIDVNGRRRPAPMIGDRHRRRHRSGGVYGQRSIAAIIVNAAAIGTGEIARCRSLPVIGAKAGARLRPDVESGGSGCCDQFGAAITVQIDGSDSTQRLRAANDVDGFRGGEPDADDERLVGVETDAIAVSVAVEVRKDGCPVGVRARRTEQRAQTGTPESPPHRGPWVAHTDAGEHMRSSG
jgi:hypothetical protein